VRLWMKPGDSDEGLKVSGKLDRLSKINILRFFVKRASLKITALFPYV
jgi:hypothetical protein